MSDWRRIDLRRSARRGVATLSRRLVAWGHQTDDEERRRQWSARLGAGLSIGRNARVTEMELRVFSSEPGRVAVGDLTYVRGTLVLFLPESSITIGARSQLNGGIVEAATSVTIGDDVLIGREVIILDHDGHSLSWSERQHDAVRALRGEKDWRVVDRAPVHICDKAWLGARVLVLKGVTIGTGAVVGAGSVVTKDVPAWTVVAGNPARVVRELAAGERG